MMTVLMLLANSNEKSGKSKVRSGHRWGHQNLNILNQAYEIIDLSVFAETGFYTNSY